MTLKTLAAASCLSLAMATSTFAAPITLDFEFDGVTGTFYGLDDADGTSSATRYDFHFFGSSWTNVSSAGAIPNSFEFFSGDLIFVDFLHTPSVTNSRLESLDLFTADLIFADSLFDSAIAGDITYTINPVAAVPLPAGGLLLLSGIGGVAALKRRKKRAA